MPVDEIFIKISPEHLLFLRQIQAALFYEIHILVDEIMDLQAVAVGISYRAVLWRVSPYSCIFCKHLVQAEQEPMIERDIHLCFFLIIDADERLSLYEPPVKMARFFLFYTFWKNL